VNDMVQVQLRKKHVANTSPGGAAGVSWEFESLNE
jgi:hypothetical protein